MFNTNFSFVAPKRKVAKEKGGTPTTAETSAQPKTVCAGKKTSMFLLPAAVIHDGLKIRGAPLFFTNSP